MANKTTTPPPAYFLSLSLENVRSFGDKQTISFTNSKGNWAKWTVILGDNGVGKTTVLKALASLMPMRTSDNDLKPAYNKDWQNRWVPVRSGRQAKPTIKVLDDSLPKGARELSGFRVSLMSCSVTTKNSSLNLKTVKYHLALPFNDTQALGRQWDKTISKLGGLLCYGYGAGRTTGNSTLSETPEAVDTCASLFDDRADLLNPEEWFLNIDYGSKLASAQGTQLADARNRVEKMLIDVLPGVTKIQIVASGTPQKPQISLQFLLHSTWVRLRDMSLGYQTLVVWLTDLASKLYIRYPESDNPLAEPAIVLIDEIDLHLHPKWQRELLSMLGTIFPETQFIATAHSPLVVQAATDAGANVVLLKREGDQTIATQNPVDVRGWRVDQILTSSFFNLETARSVETEKKLARQATLLNQEKLTARQRRELDDLTLELEGQPMGSSDPDAEEEEEAMLRELTRRVGKRPKA